MKAFAYLNHGRWVLECPHGCGQAWLLADIAEVAFSCDLCSLRVSGTTEKQAAEIDVIVSGRPLANRNWYPGESLEMLRLENARHGLVNT